MTQTTADGEERRGGMHFAVAASTVSPEVDYRHTVNMSKIGLLYADHVTLYSIDAALFRTVESQKERKPIEHLEENSVLWERMFPDPDKRRQLSNVVARYKYLSTKKHRTPSEQHFLHQLDEILTSGPFEDAVNETLHKPGGAELKLIMDCGLVTIHEFRSKLKLADFLDGEQRNAAVDDMVVEFVESTMSSIASGTTYPLLDDLAATAVQENLQYLPESLSTADRWRGQHAGLAGNLIERLPLFQEAGVDEILDIRRALATPLRQFRTGIARYADDLKSVPWDKDFTTEVDQHFLREIEPVILSLEEAIKENNPLDKIVKRASAAGVIAGGGVTLHTIVSNLHALPNLLSTSLAATPIAAKTAYDVFDEWRKGRREIEQNQLYFWVGAKKRLEHGN